MIQENGNQQDTDKHLPDKLSAGDVSRRLNVFFGGLRSGNRV